MNIRLTSFATYKDLVGYIKCLLHDGGENYCYNYGDNGMGAPALGSKVTAQEKTPMCALDDKLLIQHFGSVHAAKDQIVRVTLKDRDCICVIADLGPAGICDLNPAALKALGLDVETELSANGTVEFLPIIKPSH